MDLHNVERWCNIHVLMVRAHVRLIDGLSQLHAGHLDESEFVDIKEDNEINPLQ